MYTKERGVGSFWTLQYHKKFSKYCNIQKNCLTPQLESKPDNNQQKILYAFPIGNWRKLGKWWRTLRTIFPTFQNIENPHPAGSENIAFTTYIIWDYKYQFCKTFVQYHNTSNPNVPSSSTVSIKFPSLVGESLVWHVSTFLELGSWIHLYM